MENQTKKIIQVPYIDQSVKYPTGCESVTTVMMLNYLGITITVDDFINKYLPKRNFETINGKLYGPNPNKCFVGSPYDPNSYGCYAPVIINALNQILDKNKYKIINETNTDTKELIEKYINKNIPVIYWSCIDMKKTFVGETWILFDEEKEFTWMNNEHCLLLVGYDENKYYFNDPWDNHGLIGYDKNIVEDRHKDQYNMAIGIEKI